MQISEGKASMDNILDLHNSLYPTQPHSLIANLFLSRIWLYVAYIETLMFTKISTFR